MKEENFTTPQDFQVITVKLRLLLFRQALQPVFQANVQQVLHRTPLDKE
jgi:hypothetical protein